MPDGVRLYLRCRPSNTTSRSCIVIVHGHGEHGGRYDHVAEHLTRTGHAVFAFDLRGHGMSEGRRAYVDRFDHFIRDLDAIVAHARTAYAEIPLFLLGHSLGGLISLQYAREHPGTVAGVVASSPFLIAAVPIPRPLLFFSNVISALFPALPTLDLRGRPLTHDAAMRADRDADPLVYRGRVRARTGNEMRLAGLEMVRHAHQLTCPLYVLHGTADELADWRGSLALFGQTGSDDKAITLYRDLYHETLNEIGRDQIIAGISRWLEEQLM